MNKVIVDKSFFDLTNPLSEGLITGLGKIVRRNFLIEADFNPEENPVLNKVLKLENIEINSITESKSGKTFYISVNEPDKKNVIAVSADGDIINFEQAANQLIFRLRYSSQHRKTKETDI